MKLRRVAFAPGATFFKPAGVPMRMLETVTLTIEEVEAVRLKDMEDMHQEECAKEMGVSRGTFHQIVKSAHGKLADAIVNGKAIRVEGGNFAFPGARFRCRRDGSEWTLPPGPLPNESSVSCPSCNGREIQPVPDPSVGCCGGRGRGRRGRGWHGSWGRSDSGRLAGSVSASAVEALGDGLKTAPVDRDGTAHMRETEVLEHKNT